MRNVELGIKLIPGMDEKKLSRITELLNKAGNVQGKISLDDKELQEASTIIQDFLKSASEEIQIAIDSSQIKDADKVFAAFQEELAKGAQGFDFPLPPDMTGAIAELQMLSAQWDEVKVNVEEAYKEQKKLISNLESSGSVDTPDYAKAVAEAKGLESVLERIAQAEGKASGMEVPDFSVGSKSAKKFAGDLGDVEQAEKGVADAASQIPGQLSNASETGIKFIASMEALGALSETFGSMAEQGNEFRNSLNKLAATTGATGAEFDGLKAQAEDLFVNGIGENAAQALEIVGQSKATFGKIFEGDELAGITSSVAKLGQAFGKEFNEIATRSASFAKSFGISGKETADLLALGMRDANTPADDFLDTIGEYGPLMKQAGFSAAEFIGVLKTGGDNASFTTDKIGDAIKETRIRLMEGDIQNELNGIVTDMGTRLPDALGKTLKGITDAGKSGQQSVKEVLNNTTAAIEESFAAGNIDEVMRTKLQRAIAGTPAEDLGGDLYARLFGAPIDEKVIRAKAAAAAASINASMGNNTVFDGFTKQLDIIQAKAANAMLPLASGVSAAAKTAPQLLAIKQLLPNGAVEALSGKFMGMAQGITTKLGPALKSIGPALMNPYVLASVVAVGAATYFFTQTEKGKAIWQKISDAAVAFYEKVKPLLKAIGEFFITYISVYIDILMSNIEALGSIIGGLVEGVVTLGTKIAQFFGLIGSGGKDAGDSIGAMTDVVQNLTISFEAVGATVSAFIKNVGEAVGLLLSGDFSGFAAKVASSYEDASKVGQAVLQKRVDEIKTDKLQAKIEDGFVIKESLDKNNAIGELVAKYKSATTDIQKENLAKMIAEQVPGAMKGITATVDKATGAVKESYAISLDVAEKYVGDQNKILNDKQAGSKSAFVELFQKQAEQLDKNKAKLGELSTAIAGAKPGKEQDDLLEKFKETEKEVTKNAEALKLVTTQGEGLGVTGKEIETLGKKSKLSDEEAQKLAGTFVAMKAKMKEAKLEMNALAASFNTGLQNATTLAGQASAAFAQSSTNIAELRKKLGSTKDKEERAGILKEIDANKEAMKDVQKQGKEAQKQVLNLNESMARAQHAIGADAKTSLQYAQAKIAADTTQADFDFRAFKIKQDGLVIDQKRARNGVDDLILSKEELATQERKLDSILKHYNIQGGSVEQQREIVAELQKQVRETGKLDESLLKEKFVKIGLRAAEGFDGAKGQITTEILGAVLDIQEKSQVVLQMEATLAVSTDEIEQLQSDLRRRNIELDIEFGSKNEDDLVAFVQGQTATLQSKVERQRELIANINTAILAAEKARNEAVTDTSRQASKAQILLLQQQAADALKVSLELEGQVIEKQAESRTIAQGAYAKQLGDLDAAHGEVMAKLTQQNDQKLALLASLADLESAARTAAVEKINADTLAAIDSLGADKTKAYDEAASKELEDLEALHKNALISEREYQLQKLQMTKDGEAKKREFEEQAAADKEIAERKHQKSLLVIQKDTEGKKRLGEIQKVRNELSKESEAIRAKIKIAESAYASSSTEENKKQLTDLQTALETTSTVLADKGSEIAALAQLTGDTVSTAIGEMFSGSEEGVADSFRSLFSTVAGALKQMLSAFVLQYVLSPAVTGWLTATFGPFGAAIGIPIITGLVTNVVGALANPVIEGLTSFSTGGRVDSPTMAIVGDASRLGSSNREWIFRDEQLNAVIDGALMRSSVMLNNRLASLESALLGERVIGVLAGEDIRLVSQRSKVRRSARTINP